MIGEWENLWQLVTPEGSLFFNDTGTDGRRFQLNPAKCSATLPVRVTDDDLPQADGKIPHRRWRSGYSVHLAIEPWTVDGDDFECASGEDLVEMLDLLGLHINSMIRTGLVQGFPNARLLFSPTGSADRMFDRCQLSGTPNVTLDGALGGIQVEFDLDTTYPYYIEAEETQTVLAATGVEIIENAGNTQYFGVVKIDGPTSNFILFNNTILDQDGNPLQIVYDDSLPGAAAIAGGNYVEINLYTGTAFLNGSGSNLVAGLDFRYTDFWPLVPGLNQVGLVGASGTFLSNGAWA